MEPAQYPSIMWITIPLRGQGLGERFGVGPTHSTGGLSVIFDFLFCLLLYLHRLRTPIVDLSTGVVGPSRIELAPNHLLSSGSSVEVTLIVVDPVLGEDGIVIVVGAPLLIRDA